MVKIIYYLIPYVIALFTVIIFGYLKNKKYNNMSQDKKEIIDKSKNKVKKVSIVFNFIIFIVMFISLVFLIEAIVDAYEETNNIRNFTLNSVLAIQVDENGNLVTSLPTMGSDTPLYSTASITLLLTIGIIIIKNIVTNILMLNNLDEKQEKNVKEHNKGNVAYLIILFIVIFILTRFIMLAFMRIG